jgi:hypothetical protein
MGNQPTISEERVKDLVKSFEWWLRQGPDGSQITFTRHKGSVWCKGIEYNGPPEKVLQWLHEANGSELEF